MTGRPGGKGQRLRLAAAVILVASLLLAAVVFVAAERRSGAGAAVDEGGSAGSEDIGALGRARELQQLERIGGTAAVLTFRFRLWFESLWHGRRLALSLALIGLAAAGLCLHLAGLVDESV